MTSAHARMSSMATSELLGLAAMGLATASVCFLGGIFIGRKSFGKGANSSVWPAPRATIQEADSGESSDEEEDEEEEEELKDLSDFKANANEEYKLVLVVRTDLGMTKGKMAAQCSHATLACYKALSRSSSTSTTSENQVLRRWERQGQAKVALQVKNEDELVMLQAQAISLGLCAQVVHDAGRTQIAAGSATVLGVGPGPKGVIDQVTGHLKLL